MTSHACDQTQTHTHTHGGIPLRPETHTLCRSLNTLQGKTPVASPTQSLHKLKLQWKKCHSIDFRRAGDRWRWGTSCIIQAVQTAKEQAAVSKHFSNTLKVWTHPINKIYFLSFPWILTLQSFTQSIKTVWRELLRKKSKITRTSNFNICQNGHTN